MLYADDTLIIGKNPEQIQPYIDFIAEEGKRYGLLLNLSKLEMLEINIDARINDSAGKVIAKKEYLKYLGALLHKTGRIDSELNCKIGMAKTDFRKLVQIWNHTGITRDRKMQLYQSLILSRLLYGLQTVWLPKQSQKRLDAFHYQCLQELTGIAHSYISQVTNENILKK